MLFQQFIVDRWVENQSVWIASFRLFRSLGIRKV